MSERWYRRIRRKRELRPPEVFIQFSLKQFTIHLLLSILKGFVFLKQNAVSIARTVVSPARPFGRFLFRSVGLPGYRLFLFTRRLLARAYGSTKNKFLFIFSNRYVFHAAIVTVVAVTSVINMRASEVRAETFGSRSLLMTIVSPEEAETIEEVTGEALVGLAPSFYYDSYAISPEEVEIDLAYEERLAAILGNGVIAAPTISEPAVTALRTATEEYEVQEGDVLGSIAEKFGLKLNTVLWANNLTYRSTIRPGQKLVILPTDGVVYSVKKGDTVSSIAKKYNTTMEKIIAFNKLSAEETLQISQSLILPDATPPSSAPVRYAAPASSIFTGTRGGTAPAAATGDWLWPSDSCYITVYFNQYYRYGLHKGLDIDGDYTSNIYASRGGTVTRAAGFGGYGRCVDIDHGDGYKTRYGHASKLFVSVGDEVAAGDIIGKVGTTGKSTGTHLHFEIMNDGVKVNPLNYIRCR